MNSIEAAYINDVPCSGQPVIAGKTDRLKRPPTAVFRLSSADFRSLDAGLVGSMYDTIAPSYFSGETGAYTRTGAQPL